jgi:hypothetical protein
MELIQNLVAGRRRAALGLCYTNPIGSLQQRFFPVRTVN